MTTDTKTFQDISLDSLLPTAERLKRDDWRCVQMLCVSTDDGVDLTYSFFKDGHLDNYQVRGVKESDTVPSIQNLFLGIFPFENEASDLFGVNFEGMVLDFAGHFYAVAESEPMTILTPEAAERKAKEAKKAAAAAAKAKKVTLGDDTSTPAQASGSATADLEAKLAGMDPEKAAKVRAAMEAKAAKAAQASADASDAPIKPAGLSEEEIEAKIAGLDPEKAAKVRAALEAKAKKEAAKGGDE